MKKQKSKWTALSHPRLKKKAIMMLKNGKGAAPEQIPAEAYT